MLPPADAGGIGSRGPMEEMLAQRIVGLSWRLRRAERLQTAAFDKIETPTEPSAAHAVGGGFQDARPAGRIELASAGPGADGPGGPRKAVQDFNQERVLDRLLVYERRIENSLYRTMAELRKLRKEGGIAGSIGEGSQTRDIAFGVPVPPMNENQNPRAGLPELVEAEDYNIHGQDARATHGRDAHATEPQGGTPNAGGDESCETNPMCDRKAWKGGCSWIHS